MEEVSGENLRDLILIFIFNGTLRLSTGIVALMRESRPHTALPDGSPQAMNTKKSWRHSR